MKKHHTILCTCLLLAISRPIIAATCLSDTLTQPTHETGITLPGAVITTDSGSGSGTSIHALSESARQRLEELHGKLDNESPFHGLYLIGNAAQRTPGNGHQGYLGLEWQLFRRGYFEGQRKTELSTTEAMIDAYTLQRHLRSQALDQALYQVKRMQNHLLAYLYQQLQARQSQLTALYRKRLHAGYATQQALAQEESELLSIRDKLMLYDGLPQRPIPASVARLINHIDTLRLAPLPKLEKQAIAHSGIDKLQQLFIRQAVLTTPRWSDNLTLGIYARRRTDYVGPSGNEIGIQLAIPIDGNLKHDAVVQRRTQLQSLQLAADKTRLREQLASLSDQFRHAQDTIRQLQNSYALLLTQAGLACTQARHVIPSLENTPEKTLEQMPVKVLEQQRNILVARLDAYRLLLQLQAKVQPRPGEAWYSIR